MADSEAGDAEGAAAAAGGSSDDNDDDGARALAAAARGVQAGQDNDDEAVLEAGGWMSAWLLCCPHSDVRLCIEPRVCYRQSGSTLDSEADTIGNCFL
jgi:hypothetical protein